MKKKIRIKVVNRNIPVINKPIEIIILKDRKV